MNLVCYLLINANVIFRFKQVFDRFLNFLYFFVFMTGGRIYVLSTALNTVIKYETFDLDMKT